MLFQLAGAYFSSQMTKQGEQEKYLAACYQDEMNEPCSSKRGLNTSP